MLLLAILFAWLVARSMARSLRELRHGALSIAQYGLPQAVARLRDPALSAQLSPVQVANQIAEPLPVRSKDEFGQVTEAFNAVHLEAVRTAAEQAALRSSVATMFVNLARRSQILVDRLIGHLDRLERGEEDPDRLAELFQLDHLATRMRRNDENLLVLAGADSTRVQREPAALIDVLRAAQSEVEHYTRIEFGVDRPGHRGRRARGQRPGAPRRRAVRQRDRVLAAGLAASWSRPAGSATARCSTSRTAASASRPTMLPSSTSGWPRRRMVDVAVSRMMGLVVVARLAARHGVKVELRPRPERGTVADVTPADRGPGAAGAGRPAGAGRARRGDARRAAGARRRRPPPGGRRRARRSAQPLALETRLRCACAGRRRPPARRRQRPAAAFDAAGPPPAPAARRHAARPPGRAAGAVGPDRRPAPTRHRRRRRAAAAAAARPAGAATAGRTPTAAIPRQPCRPPTSVASTVRRRQSRRRAASPLGAAGPQAPTSPYAARQSAGSRPCPVVRRCRSSAAPVVRRRRRFPPRPPAAGLAAGRRTDGPRCRDDRDARRPSMTAGCRTASPRSSPRRICRTPTRHGAADLPGARVGLVQHRAGRPMRRMPGRALPASATPPDLRSPHSSPPLSATATAGAPTGQRRRRRAADGRAGDAEAGRGTARPVRRRPPDRGPAAYRPTLADRRRRRLGGRARRPPTAGADGDHAAGLPKRTPMAQLVPGGVDKGATTVQRRTPEAVRGLLSAYHRGVQRGRDPAHGR